MAGAGRRAGFFLRRRATSRATAGTAVASMNARSQDEPASVPAPSVWTRPEDVDDRGGAVEVAPALAADPAARVEREPERGREVAADDPGGDEGRPVVDDHRDRDARRSRLQERVAEQRDAVQRDRHQARERAVLVERDERAAAGGRAAEAGGERQPDQDGDGDEDQRDDARGAAHQPPGVVGGALMRKTLHVAVVADR